MRIDTSKPLSSIIEYFENLPEYAVDQSRGYFVFGCSDYLPPWERNKDRKHCGRCVGAHLHYLFKHEEYKLLGRTLFVEFDTGMALLSDVLEVPSYELLYDLLRKNGSGGRYPISVEEWHIPPAEVFRNIRDKYGEIPGQSAEFLAAYQK